MSAHVTQANGGRNRQPCPRCSVVRHILPGVQPRTWSQIIWTSALYTVCFFDKPWSFWASPAVHSVANKFILKIAFFMHILVKYLKANIKLVQWNIYKISILLLCSLWDTDTPSTQWVSLNFIFRTRSIRLEVYQLLITAATHTHPLPPWLPIKNPFVLLTWRSYCWIRKRIARIWSQDTFWVVLESLHKLFCCL